ncbi:methylmalonyl-CoA epimerase [Chloroflexota bacterium]
MIVKVDHIGIAVNSLEEAIKLYADALGLESEHTETVVEQRVKAAMIPVGDTRIELLESTDSEGPIAKHIQKRGEGIHHLAIEVSDIEGMLEAMKARGIPLVDMEPRIGAGGTRVAFLHPRATKVLIELVEH